MKIVAHTMVKNEERWIWYALMSIIDHVDEIMVWDTGSQDTTTNVVNSIKSNKIKTRYFKISTPLQHTQIRQKMLDETRSDWVMILDGDEVWPPDAISESLKTIRTQGKVLDYVINPYLNLLGDVYHAQEEKAGRYQIGSHRGHLTIRFFNYAKLFPITYEKGYPDEGLKNKQGIFLQNMSQKLVRKMTNPYFHMTHLLRSSVSSGLINRSYQKAELGIKIQRTFRYPISFYLPRPDIIISPWKIKNIGFSLNSYWQSPLRWLKRRVAKI